MSVLKRLVYICRLLISFDISFCYRPSPRKQITAPHDVSDESILSRSKDDCDVDVGPLLDYDYAEATAVESQMLLDLKEHMLSWSSMLQEISESGGSAMANVLSMNEKYTKVC